MNARHGGRSAGFVSPAGPADRDDDVWPEPSRAELAAIEAEWPLIAAEVAVVDAEVAVASEGGELAARRLADAARAVRSIAASLVPTAPDRLWPVRRRLGGAA